MGFYVLTTNVTGHAALFAEKLSQRDLRSAVTVGLWMLSFLGGAFTSGFYIGKVGSDNRYAYTVPLVIEMVILLLVGTFGYTFDKSTVETEYFAGSLLFAMGMQNAMVTMISGAVVRTTHLTGMFTDLGIDLSALIVERRKQKGVISRIVLRLVIISSFLLGGILGGFAFKVFTYHTFYIPVAVLFVAMSYDFFRFRALRILHQIKS